jgi:hypothetical protein
MLHDMLDLCVLCMTRWTGLVTTLRGYTGRFFYDASCLVTPKIQCTMPCCTTHVSFIYLPLAYKPISSAFPTPQGYTPALQSRH